MNYIDRVVEKLANTGFTMHEVMTGTHVFNSRYVPAGPLPDGYEPNDELFMEFEVDWGPDNLAEWLNPKSPGFMKHPLKGIITVEGLCEAAPCRGMMELNYFTDYTLIYYIEFKANGDKMLYQGKKRDVKLWKPWELHKTHTECDGVLFNLASRELISTSLTHFRMRTAPAFVSSFRLR
jgi:hypothetical protein